MTPEVWFHGAEVLILLFGVAYPMVRSSQRLRQILSDFPPHRHINGKILFPKGYAPTDPEETNG